MPHSRDVKACVSQWALLVLMNNAFCRRFERPEGGVLFFQLIAPKVIRTRLLELIHVGVASHFASKKTCEQLQCRVCWPNWRSDAEWFYKVCAACN